MSMHDSRANWDPWTYRQEVGMSGCSGDIVGFDVEATDGSIGKIDRASEGTGSGNVVVDTGPWIFGRKVMLPAGMVDRVDWDQRCVYVNCTKEQVKDSPELGEDDLRDGEAAYRERLGTYYGAERGDL